MALPAPSPPASSPPGRRRWLRWLSIGLGLVLLLPVAAVAILLATFDPDALRPRIEAAVERATGRDLAIAGPIEVEPALVPTIAIHDVALANLPGGSRPEMLRVAKVEVRFALLPLLAGRVEVRRILLQGPDLLLETTAEGRRNWVFAAPPEPATSDPATPDPATLGGVPVPVGAGAAPEILIDRIAIADGRLAWHGAAGEPPLAVAIPRLEAVSPPPGGPVALQGRFALDGLEVGVDGRIGPPAAVLDPAAPPWPVALALTAEGARLTVEGEVARPRAMAGYRLALAATVPEPGRFARLLPDLSLPPLGPVTASAVLSDAAGGGPALADLQLSIGESDLGAVHPGLRLTRLTATLPAPDQPLVLAAEGRVAALPLALDATLGAPAALLAEEGAPPWPVRARLRAGRAEARASGTIAGPRRLTGFDLALSLAVPALAELAPVLPGLPDLTAVEASARIAGRGAAFAEGAVLRAIEARSSAGDLRGEITWARGPRPAVSGSLRAGRLDLDALRPAPGAAAPAGPAPAPPGAAAPPGPERVIPALPLPLAPLRGFDADLRLAAQALTAGGVAYRDVSTHLRVQAGRARLDPLAATLPGGRVTGSLLADAAQDPPALRLVLGSGALDLGALQAAHGLPPLVTGPVELDVALAGRGADLRALAASLEGHLGLAQAEGGSLDRRALAALPRDLRRLMPGLAGAGDIPLRCLALRIVAADGMARLGTLLVETSRIGSLGGEGGVNLRDETLGLRLLPDLRLVAVALRAPVLVTGTLAEPRFGVSPEAALGAGIGAFLSLQRTPDRSLQALAGALGAGRDPAATLDCARALAEALGRPAPAPTRDLRAIPEAVQGTIERVVPALPGVARDLTAPAQDLLRGLFGRGR